MKRFPVQIAISEIPLMFDPEDPIMISVTRVICNDGSMWSRTKVDSIFLSKEGKPVTEQDGGWLRSPDIPQPKEVPE